MIDSHKPTFSVPIWAGSVSTRCDRLPKLNPISFWIGEPAELPEIVVFTFRIDGDTFVSQAAQHSIEVIAKHSRSRKLLEPLNRMALRMEALRRKETVGVRAAVPLRLYLRPCGEAHLGLPEAV